jgi:hypothetical protein
LVRVRLVLPPPEDTFATSQTPTFVPLVWCRSNIFPFAKVDPVVVNVAFPEVPLQLSLVKVGIVAEEYAPSWPLPNGRPGAIQFNFCDGLRFAIHLF